MQVPRLLTFVTISARCGLATLVLLSCAGRAIGVEQLNGDLEALIAELKSSDYVLRKPATDARPYVDPTPALPTVDQMASLLNSGDISASASFQAGSAVSCSQRDSLRTVKLRR